MSAARDIEQRAAAWLVRREQPAWDAADAAALDAWLDESVAHKAAFWRLEEGWAATARLAAMRGGDAAPVRRAMPVWALAACVALVCLAALALGSGLFAGRAARTIDVATAIGERRQVRLADGSAVMLNTASRIRAAIGGSGGRQVWLDRGEAYFEVAHDARHPFTILAGDRKVTVLGTRFSVRREGATVTVAVVEGRVRVEDATSDARGSAAIMTAGDVAVSRGPSMLLADRSPERVEDGLSWRRGMLTFDKVTLGEAAAEFNRYNHRQIRFGDDRAAQIRIGGTFEADNVDAFVRLLRVAFGLQVKQDGEAVTIKS